MALVGVGGPAIGLIGGEGAKYINGVGVGKAEPVFPYQAGIQEFNGNDKLCTCNYIIYLYNKYPLATKYTQFIILCIKAKNCVSMHLLLSKFNTKLHNLCM